VVEHNNPGNQYEHPNQRLPAISTTIENPAKRDQKNSESFNQSIREWARLVIEIAALIALVCYVGWTKVQAVANEKAARAAKESADAAIGADSIAQQTLEITNRADVNIENVIFEGWKIGGIYKVSYILRNTGHITATGITESQPSVFYGPSLTRISPHKRFFILPNKDYGFSMGPGEIWKRGIRLGVIPPIPKEIRHEVLKMILTRRKIEEAIKGKMSLQILISVSYFDGFGNARSTWNLYSWDTLLRTVVRIQSGQE
jgi:hypothetical protein